MHYTMPNSLCPTMVELNLGSDPKYKTPIIVLEKENAPHHAEQPMSNYGRGESGF